MDPAFAVSYLSWMQQLMADHGWAVQYVGPGDGEPQYCYTVGFYQHGLPELVVFGPTARGGQEMLNRLGDRVKAGQRYADGDVVRDLTTKELRLMEVLDSREHLTVAHLLSRSERPLPALQVIYADRDGRWPWQPGSRIADVPVLGVVPDLGAEAA